MTQTARGNRRTPRGCGGGGRNASCSVHRLRSAGDLRRAGALGIIEIHRILVRRRKERHDIEHHGHRGLRAGGRGREAC
eukprot:6815732-Prymnesium_polylepis.1